MSRELDARVASKVLSLPTQEEHDNMPGNLDAGYPIQLRRYSTDMNAAMAIIEFLGDIKTGESSSDIFDLCFADGFYEAGWGFFIVKRRSPAEAICLAALRAVGDDAWVENYIKENKDV